MTGAAVRPHAAFVMDRMRRDYHHAPAQETAR